MDFLDPKQSWPTGLTHSPPEPLDIMFVGAHPDDVEIACGGTIHRLGQQGYRVGIVDLTDGEPTPKCAAPAVRWEEARAAAATLGVVYRRILPLTNRRLFDGFDERVALAKELRRWRPQVVVGLGSKTPMASPDHWQAVQITDAAIFYARLSKWEEYFDGLPTHAISRQIYVCLAFDPASLAGVGSQFTVDIGLSLEKKLEAIACYKTQFPPEKNHIFERVRSLAVAAGMAAGFQAGEIFANSKPIGVVDLMKSLNL